MSDEKMVDLAERLLQLTKEGKIEWERSGQPSVGRFIFSGPSASVTLQRFFSDDESPPIVRINVLNSEGDSVEKLDVVSPEVPVSGSMQVRRIHPTQRLVNTLYSEVRRRVMKADEVMDGLLSALPAAEEPDETGSV